MTAALYPDPIPACGTTRKSLDSRLVSYRQSVINCTVSENWGTLVHHSTCSDLILVSVAMAITTCNYTWIYMTTLSQHRVEEKLTSWKLYKGTSFYTCNQIVFTRSYTWSHLKSFFYSASKIHTWSFPTYVCLLYLATRKLVGTQWESKVRTAMTVVATMRRMLLVMAAAPPLSRYS